MSFEWWERWNKSIIKRTTQYLQNIGNTLIETITYRILTHDKDHTIPKVIERHYNRATDTVGQNFNNWKTFIQDILGTLHATKGSNLYSSPHEETSLYGFYHQGTFISGTLDNLIDHVTINTVQSITDKELLKRLSISTTVMKNNCPNYILERGLLEIWNQKLQEKIDMINNQLESREAIEISTHRAGEDESNITPTTVSVEANVERWMVANPSLN